MLQRVGEQEVAIRTTLCLLNRTDITISVEIIKGIVEIIAPFKAVTIEISADQHFWDQKLFHYQGHYKGLPVLV